MIEDFEDFENAQIETIERLRQRRFAEIEQDTRLIQIIFTLGPSRSLGQLDEAVLISYSAP